MGNDSFITAYFLRVDEKTGIPYRGYLSQISNTLKALQEYVNFDRPHGRIEAYPLNESVKLIIHEEGKFLGYPCNRAILNGKGDVLDVLVGNVLCVRSAGEDFTDIEESDVPIIEALLKPIREVSEGVVYLASAASLPKYEEVRGSYMRSNQ